jgi:hypothetical protein
VHASAAPSDVVKMVSGRFPTSLLALCRSNFSCRANALLRWMYPDIHQSVMCFPDLVAASGGRIFTAYWLMENTKKGGSWSALVLSWVDAFTPNCWSRHKRARIGRAPRRFPQAWRRRPHIPRGRSSGPRGWLEPRPEPLQPRFAPRRNPEQHLRGHPSRCFIVASMFSTSLPFELRACHWLKV